MKDLLDLILKNITTQPEAALVEESDEDGITCYTIKVAPDDMGRVIGKDGKVIRAIRSLAHVVAIRQGKRFRIKIADGEGEASPEIKPESQEIGSTVKPEEPEDELIAGAIDIPDAEKPVEDK